MARITEALRARGRASASALLLTLSLAASSGAGDGTLRVRESALDEFAAAIQPLTLTRTWSFTLWIPVPNPFLFGIPTPVPVPFACAATATVTGLSFDITPGSVSVRGNLSGAVCGLAYSSTLSTAVTISIDSAARRLMVRPLGPMTVSATVNFLGLNIAAPFGNVSVAPSLTVMSIPLDAVPFEIETPSGPRTLALVTRNHQLSLRDGYFEIEADAFFR